MQMNRKGCLAALVSTVVFAGVANAAQFDGFEDFSNGASGDSVATYSSPLGNWTDSSTASSTATNLPTVVKADGTAYSGSNYLRMTDSSATAVTSATLGLTTPVSADGATISFALRDDTGYNNNQVVIKSGSTILAQVGLQYNSSTSAKVTYTSYTSASGGAANNPVGNSVGQVGTTGSTGWYLFTLKYSISGTTGSYLLTITDPSNNQFYSGTVTGNSGLVSGTTYNISSLILQTAGTRTGSADVDAITVAVPEPVSQSVIGLGGAGMMLVRRRRQKRAAV